LKHAGRPNWQNSFELPPGVRYHDYSLRRHESPFPNEGNTAKRDAFPGRMDRLFRERVRASAHENDAAQYGRKSGLFDYENGEHHPLYILSDDRFAAQRSLLSSGHRGLAVQVQHTRQLEMLMSQLMSGHDWAGVADVLARLCAEYRELPFAAFQASIGVFARHRRDVEQRCADSHQHNYSPVSSQSSQSSQSSHFSQSSQSSQSSQFALGASHLQSSADSGLVRFLRGCVTRHVPYRHLALRELADHFMHHRDFVSAQNVLRQNVQEFPFSGDPEVHGRIGICLVELLFSNYEKQRLDAERNDHRRAGRSKSRQDQGRARTRNQHAAEAWVHLKTALTMQPTRYTELAYCVDLLLGTGDTAAARHILEDFCRINPRMHAPHAALGRFLGQFAPNDLTARLFVAARALALDPSDDNAATECIELYRRARSGQWLVVMNVNISQVVTGLLPLFANHVESVESVDNLAAIASSASVAAMERRGLRLKSAWEYLADLCDTSLQESSESDDSDAVLESDWDSNMCAAWAGWGGGLLLPSAGATPFRPYWFDSGACGHADHITRLPPGWKIEYQIVEGLPMRKPSKTDPSHRFRSYIKHTVVDPATGCNHQSLEDAMEAARNYADPNAAASAAGEIPLAKRRVWWQAMFFGSNWTRESSPRPHLDDANGARMIALAKAVMAAKSKVEVSPWLLG
jgi:hypothetical protein